MFSAPRRVFMSAFGALLASCASNQIVSTASAVEGASVKNSKIYIYSLLDLRDAEFGPSMLAEVEKLLTFELAKGAAISKVLRFKDSEIGRYYSTTSGGMSIPIKQMLDSNLHDEQGFGADYRLIIFPSKMTLTGAWKFYDIRWEIFDIKTNKRIWGSISQGKHLTLWKSDEDPQARAKTIVDAVIAEMRKSGIL